MISSSRSWPGDWGHSWMSRLQTTGRHITGGKSVWNVFTSQKWSSLTAHAHVIISIDLSQVPLARLQTLWTINEQKNNPVLCSVCIKKLRSYAHKNKVNSLKSCLDRSSVSPWRPRPPTPPNTRIEYMWLSGRSKGLCQQRNGAELVFEYNLSVTDLIEVPYSHLRSDTIPKIIRAVSQGSEASCKNLKRTENSFHLMTPRYSREKQKYQQGTLNNCCEFLPRGCQQKL